MSSAAPFTTATKQRPPECGSTFVPGGEGSGFVPGGGGPNFVPSAPTPGQPTGSFIRPPVVVRGNHYTGYTTTHNPLQPGAGAVPTESDDGNQSKLQILDTAYAPLFDLGQEADGYGLYTYLLFRRQTQRELAFIHELEDLPAAEQLRSLPRSEIDLLLIPAKRCEGASQRGLDDCAKNIMKSMMVNLGNVTTTTPSRRC